MSSLFDAGAERAALESGRPLSQERIEIEHGSAPRPLTGPLLATISEDGEPSPRYVAQRTGSIKRPWEVVDTQGGWVVFRSYNAGSAYARAHTLNHKAG